MKILVTGASGLLGCKISLLALKKGHEVYSVYREHTVDLGEPVKLDLTRRSDVYKVFSELKPEAVIHAAAYTDVDGCEADRDMAWRVNAESTKHVAEASASMGAHLTYVSTDYVFDGEKGLYTEDDEPNPVNYYGYTKLKGEEYVKQHAEQWCIARTSVIYGWGVKHRLNFATWLISNLSQGREVKTITDQHVSPTFNTNLAEMLLEIAERRITGVLHTAGANRVSRYGFALKLAEAFKLDASLVKPAEMSEMPWKAKRPRDSSLNVGKATILLSAKPLRIEQALEMMKKETFGEAD
ncbi:MAG: dTDP-4-dehydrorhamnose reductase [Thermoproteota archaeon]